MRDRVVARVVVTPVTPLSERHTYETDTNFVSPSAERGYHILARN